MKNICLVCVLIIVLLSVAMVYGKPLRLNPDPVDSLTAPSLLDDNFDQFIQQEMENLRRRFGTGGFDRMMNMNSFNTPGSLFNRSFSAGISADTYIQDNRFVVKCEVPGMSKEEVKLYFSGDLLVIEGEKKSTAQKEDQKKNYYTRELSYGKVSRSFSIPENADRKSIKASFQDGILTVQMDLNEVPEKKIDYIPIE